MLAISSVALSLNNPRYAAFLGSLASAFAINNLGNIPADKNKILKVLKEKVMKKEALITGGAGYVGSKPVPYLLERDLEIIVIDTMWFENYLNDHPRLTIIKKDIRNIARNRIA